MSDLPAASPGRPLPRLALAALACIGLGAWLALPRERPRALPTSPPVHVVLVDASASATRTRVGWARFVREQLVSACDRAAAEGADLAVVRFAADVAVDHGPAPATGFRTWLEGGDREPWPPRAEARLQGATELDRALEVAEGMLLDERRPGGELTVLSDGTYTGRDPRARLVKLASHVSRLTRFLPIGLPAPDRVDLAVAELRAPARLERGAPVAALVTIAATGGNASRESGTVRARVSLELVVDGRVETRAGRELRFSPRDLGVPGDPCLRTERLVLPAPPRGVYTLRARVVPVGARASDPTPENDVLLQEVRVGDPIVCLLLAHEERAQPLRDIFRDPAFEGIAFQSTSFLDLAPDLGAADVLVTESIGPGALPRAALGEFLRRGGGWLSLAGYGALRGWEREAGEPADWLPLVPEEPEPDEREIVLFVDGSGSMTGPPFEKVRAAVFELVLGARSNDRFRLRFFTGAMEPVVFATQGARPEDLRRDLAPLFAAKVPRGSTDVLYALDQLAAERERSEYPGLVLLVTDGRTLNWHAERSREVRQRLAAASTELAVIAIGEAADREFLTSLLLEGEHLEDATDLDQLQAVFERRVHAEQLDERPGRRARPLDPVSLGAASSVGAEVLRAQLSDPGVLEDGSLGVLGRSLRAEVRAGAEPLWRADDGPALLATQRVGAGLVAALATTPLGDWAPFLQERPALLSPLLRALGRAHGPDEGLFLSEREGELVLEGVSEGAPLAVEARFLLRSRASRPAEVLDALDPLRASGVQERELGSLVLEPPASGDGADPRTQRRGPRPTFLDHLGGDRTPGGAQEIAVALRGVGASAGDAGEPLGRVFFAPRPAAEFAPAGGRTVVWPDSSAISGEGVPDSPGVRGPHPAAAWLLGLGLVLGFLAAVGRRWRRVRALAGQGIG